MGRARIKDIDGKNFYFVTNFDKKDIGLYYLCCYLTKIPGRIEENAVDIFGNSVKNGMSLYIPLELSGRTDEFWECYEYIVPIYREKKRNK